MKKPVPSLLFVFILLSGIVSKAQVNKEGDILIDAYYGWPNLYSVYFQSAGSGTSHEITSYKSVGPGGAKIEYLFSERIGLGLNVNYASSEITYRVLETDWNTGTQAYYSYHYQIPRVRVMGTLNIHMGNDDRLDPYFSTGIGWKDQQLIRETNSPTGGYFIQNPLILPVAWRVFEFGLRGYFTPNFSGHLAVGLGGGPLVQAGLGIKL